MSELILDGNWYKKAKEELKDKKWRKEHLHGSAEFTWHMEQYITLLESVMLAYRRQHGIFEDGDNVVFNEIERKPFILKIKELGNLNLVRLEIIDNGICGYCYQSDIRHATPKEIAAGHRL